MILDASVVLAWLLQEPGSDAAERMLSRGDLAAPSIIFAEVGHVLTKQVRRRAMTPDAAFLAWRLFAVAPLRTVSIEDLGQRSLELSIAVHGVYYDCLYLALAESEQDVFVTSDESFVRAVRATSLPGLSGLARTLAEI